MRKLLPLLSILILASCTPKPPIFIVTKSSLDSVAKITVAKLEPKPLTKVDLHDFKRAFVKKYGSEEEFVKIFTKDLTAKLEVPTQDGAPTYSIEFPKLDVDNFVVSYSVMVGGGPNMPGHMQTSSTEYCVIKLDYAVKSSTGETLLEGVATERTAKGEFLHPNQSKLANAVDGVQNNLVNYLRGRMQSVNIQIPEPPK